MDNPGRVLSPAASQHFLVGVCIFGTICMSVPPFLAIVLYRARFLVLPGKGYVGNMRVYRDSQPKQYWFYFVVMIVFFVPIALFFLYQAIAIGFFNELHHR